jgi:transposase
MAKNRHLSRSIADMSFFEFRRQLEYKAESRIPSFRQSVAECPASNP